MLPSTVHTITLCVIITTVTGYLSPATAFTKAECDSRLDAGFRHCASKPCEVKGSAECQQKSSCFNYNGQRYKNCMRNATDR